MWKSSLDTARQLEDVRELERLTTSYALSRFWKNAIPRSGYSADPAWESLLALLPAGETIASALAALERDCGKSAFNMALFGVFYHTDILVDWHKSDVDGIEALLSSEIRAGKLFFPHRLGRTLYDRFDDRYHGTRTDHLDANSVQELLEGTIPGVYQIGSVVIGPLGVLRSKEHRFKPFSDSIPLWHCSDTGCQAIHSVNLNAPPVPVVLARREIARRLQDGFGRCSEWEPPLRRLLRRDKGSQGRAFVDLPEVVAECVIGPERTALMVAALQSAERQSLRETIAAARRRKDAEGSPSAIATALAPEEQLHLLLTLSDARLIELIDEAIAQRSIRIPIGEIRSSKQSYRLSGSDSRCEISSLGTRSVKGHEIPHLLACIWDAYEETGILGELEWRIRTNSGRAIREALMEYVRREGPAHAVKHLILASNTVARSVTARVSMALRHVLVDEERAVNRLMWKLGFDPEEYEDSIPRMMGRIREFRETVLSLSVIEAEEDRDRVRAVGVNLFVSVEEFLEKLIAYNVWLLAEDHFLQKNFAYEFDSARRIIPAILGASFLGEGDAAVWDVSGNTLGVLLRYLSEASKWMAGLADADRDSVRRNECDLPFYADDPHLLFPFRHTQFWADCDVNELRRFNDGFAGIAKLLQQADLAGIRNGLDHYRDEYSFPSSEAMLACASRLQEALVRADSGRYLPKLYWLKARAGNRFGFVEYEYRDYAGKVLTTYGPRTISGPPRHLYEHPVVIPPLNLIGQPNAQLILRLKERSEFSAYWEGYPRRRVISASPDVEGAVAD